MEELGDGGAGGEEFLGVAASDGARSGAAAFLRAPMNMGDAGDDTVGKWSGRTRVCSRVFV